jgi:DDE superfamily endonuclease
MNSFIAECHITCLADSGYQGLNKRHSNSQTPEKKPRGQELAPEAKRRNRELARLRIVIEHVIRHLKIFRTFWLNAIAIGVGSLACALT